MKGKILTLFIGIIIGAIIATSGFMIYNKVNRNTKGEPGMMNRQMKDGGDRFNGEKPDGDSFEKPDDEGDSNKSEMPSQRKSSSNDNI